MLLLILVIILVFIFFYSRDREDYIYGDLDTFEQDKQCEYNDACRWDSARRCTLSSGKEGTCTLGALCCPTFFALPPRGC